MWKKNNPQNTIVPNVNDNYIIILLDEVFAISRIIKVEVTVISRSRRLRLITVTEDFIFKDLIFVVSEDLIFVVSSAANSVSTTLEFTAFGSSPNTKYSRASAFWFLLSTTTVFATVWKHFRRKNTSMFMSICILSREKKYVVKLTSSIRIVSVCVA